MMAPIFASETLESAIYKVPTMMSAPRSNNALGLPQPCRHIDSLDNATSAAPTMRKFLLEKAKTYEELMMTWITIMTITKAITVEIKLDTDTTGTITNDLS
jgi:hypothetical protein